MDSVCFCDDYLHPMYDSLCTEFNEMQGKLKSMVSCIVAASESGILLLVFILGSIYLYKGWQHSILASAAIFSVIFAIINLGRCHSILQSPYFIVASLLLLSCIFLKPYVYDYTDVFEDLTDVGSEHFSDEARKRKKTTSALAMEKLQKRDPGDLPAVFPNAWIPLLQSRDLEVGQVKSVFAVGMEFAVFRGENKKSYVLNPFCPHLGANLAVGGRVDGDCIECPFHAWKFRGDDGVCVSIPLTDKVPEVAKAKTWQSCETNGFIYVWYHAEGEEPSWNIPEVPGISRGDLIYRGRTEYIVSCSHFQDIYENAADVAHFNVVHKASVFRENTLSFLFWPLKKFFEHCWDEVSWEPQSAPNKHVAQIMVSHKIESFGYTVPFSSIKGYMKQIGPLTMYIETDCILGKRITVANIIPEEPLKQRIVQQMYGEPSLKQWGAHLLFLFEAIMLERDIPIWNNKKYLKNPVLVSADHHIKRFRTWSSQFYSENSPKLQDFERNFYDW